jgi:hypothetical protein
MICPLLKWSSLKYVLNPVGAAEMVQRSTFSLLAAGAIGCARVIVMSIWLASATDLEFAG